MREGDEQSQFVQWFRQQYARYALCLRVSANAVTRTLPGRKGAIIKNVMKSQGAVFGESDIALLVPRGGYGALLIEHKGEGMPRKLTDSQSDYLEFHNSIGNLALQTRGLDELKRAVQNYMTNTTQEVGT